LILIATYYLLAQYRFNGAQAWWPLIVPLGLQAPLALFGALYLHSRRERKLQEAMSRGATFYLPQELVERLHDESEHGARASELVTGTCMVTDIEKFTAFAERMPPRDLERNLNVYYQRLFDIVSAHRGRVTDIVGDSMVAVWPSGAGPDPDAIDAAVEVGIALGQSDPAFPRTRVGLHAGSFVLGAVGATHHLEYRAVGDVINSASRVQALNKHLDTTILTTTAALPEPQQTTESEDYSRRRLGRFLLPGKEEPLEIVELIPTTTVGGKAVADLAVRFEQALDAFVAGRWDRAHQLFCRIDDEFGGDGPSRYFANWIELTNSGEAASNWDGTVRIAP
ncbi:MAG: adenylate/guanylate cyclase domain-containing protein, partial [Gammaproteobacteria bacterium]|nr:adenylate/guanylate cyclase domain-containing protein [Gammaproteobacteria bacterium]